ncbi:MAG: hypothetical protein JWO19_1494 [Bryobacterales bacterium]|nr:hypothetical protein [Bryobacterales bacterium]
MFAVTFGGGHLLLRDGVTDDGFGLKVTLNAVDHNQIRSVDRETLDSATPHSQIQASKGTNITDFGLNIEQDLLREVTGTPRDQTLGKKLTGKAALKTAGPFTLTNLQDLLARLLAESKKKHYKQHFGWVDHIREVKDPSLRHELDDLLQNRIQQQDFEGIWLALPERIDWQAVDFFTYTPAASATHHDDIRLSSFLTQLRNPATLTTEAIKARHHVYAYGNNQHDGLYRWSVYRCLYAEVTHKNAQYLLNNGKWYHVDKTFRDYIERTFLEARRRTQALPSATSGEKEEDYNERIQKSDKTLYALMDQKNIHFPGSTGGVELCDLYTKKHELIHVKKYGQSSTLSHLFAQGVNSGTLFARDAEFRKLANAKLPPSHKLAQPKQPLGAHTVTYAIISASTKPLTLPFFSKVTLNNATITLRGLGYKVQLTKIAVEGQ